MENIRGYSTIKIDFTFKAITLDNKNNGMKLTLRFNLDPYKEVWGKKFEEDDDKDTFDNLDKWYYESITIFYQKKQSALD